MDKAIAVIAAGLMLLLVLPAMRRIPLSDALRYVIIWLAVFLVLGLLYRFFTADDSAAPVDPTARQERGLA